LSEVESIRAFIEEQNKKIVRWYEAGNVDSIAEAFVDDCWQMPPHMEPIVGRKALHEFWSSAVQWGKWKFTLDTQEVAVSGSLAVERGKYVLRFTAGPMAPPGLKTTEDRGNYVVLWRREADNHWRVVWDAPVSSAPPG
jgi:ketosteroid isomerase-like protein